MEYKNIHVGEFIIRPNRFIAHVKIENTIEICHVKNTGRCKELLLHGATVYVQHFPNTKRKTSWDLIAVKKGDVLINIDSQAPNKAVKEWLLSGGLGFIPDIVKPEYQYEDSRFDFYLEQENKRWLIEVKGVTLEKDGVALFPDAPTLRGVKHIEGLARHSKEGFVTAILFVIQMDGILYFTPNEIMHPEFSQALRHAKQEGVHIMAYECEITPNSMNIRNPIEIKL